ncbi:hypothetical protein MPDQ_002795 [Monascus purpureus]|uniref:Uncharacterized protein n=1 Tax=Monascus purpureus TaxID=5098 RepID=A0A507R3W3_MONPU|nr:hypothetical protein MPDQ_002795 [Monascus purpureus]
MAVQSIMHLLASSGLLLVIVLAMIIQPIRANYCQFWSPDCIDPLAQTAVPFNFEPLYPDPLYLFYAFDASTDGSTGQPVTKTSFWLRYGGTRVNRVAINGNRTLEIAMRVGNLTGYPAGGHNACEYVLGSQCTETITQTLQYGIYGHILSGQNYTNPLATILTQMQMYTPANFSSFASEISSPQSVEMQSSGSTNSPWATWYTHDLTSASQSDQVAVAIVSRSPAYGWTTPPSLSDIQVELVCIQAPS